MRDEKRFNIARKLLFIGTTFIIVPGIMITILGLILGLLPIGGDLYNILSTIVQYTPVVGYIIVLIALWLMYRFNRGTQYAFITFVFYVIIQAFVLTYTYYIPLEYWNVISRCESIISPLLQILYMYLIMNGIIVFMQYMGESRNARKGKRNLSIFCTSLMLSFIFSLVATILSNTAILGSIFTIVSLVCEIVAYVVFYIFLIISSIKE